MKKPINRKFLIIALLIFGFLFVSTSHATAMMPDMDQPACSMKVMCGVCAVPISIEISFQSNLILSMDHALEYASTYSHIINKSLYHPPR